MIPFRKIRYLRKDTAGCFQSIYRLETQPLSAFFGGSIEIQCNPTPITHIHFLSRW